MAIKNYRAEQVIVTVTTPSNTRQLTEFGMSADAVSTNFPNKKNTLNIGLGGQGIMTGTIAHKAEVTLNLGRGSRDAQFMENLKTQSVEFGLEITVIGTETIKCKSGIVENNDPLNNGGVDLNDAVFNCAFVNNQVIHNPETAGVLVG